MRRSKIMVEAYGRAIDPKQLAYMERRAKWVQDPENAIPKLKHRFSEADENAIPVEPLIVQVVS